MTKRYLTISLALALLPAVGPLHAAALPHAGSPGKSAVVWANEDLEKLEVRGLISVVGQIPEAAAAGAAAPAPYVSRKDPEWYAEQAAQLRDELERRQAQLDGYRRALEAARSLETSTDGINLDEGDIAITPEAAINILQRRVAAAQAEFDDLEDLARRNDIAPGTLRGK
jgi:hypothetical protein